MLLGETICYHFQGKCKECLTVSVKFPRKGQNMFSNHFVNFASEFDPGHKELQTYKLLTNLELQRITKITNRDTTK